MAEQYFINKDNAVANVNVSKKPSKLDDNLVKTYIYQAHGQKNVEDVERYGRNLKRVIKVPSKKEKINILKSVSSKQPDKKMYSSMLKNAKKVLEKRKKIQEYRAPKLLTLEQQNIKSQIEKKLTKERVLSGEAERAAKLNEVLELEAMPKKPMLMIKQKLQQTGRPISYTPAKEHEGVVYAQFSDKSLTELKEVAKALKISQKGNKQQIIDRLVEEEVRLNKPKQITLSKPSKSQYKQFPEFNESDEEEEIEQKKYKFTPKTLKEQKKLIKLKEELKIKQKLIDDENPIIDAKQAVADELNIPELAEAKADANIPTQQEIDDLKTEQELLDELEATNKSITEKQGKNQDVGTELARVYQLMYETKLSQQFKLQKKQNNITPITENLKLKLKRTSGKADDIAQKYDYSFASGEDKNVTTKYNALINEQKRRNELQGKGLSGGGFFGNLLNKGITMLKNDPIGTLKKAFEIGKQAFEIGKEAKNAYDSFFKDNEDAAGGALRGMKPHQKKEILRKSITLNRLLKA